MELILRYMAVVGKTRAPAKFNIGSSGDFLLSGVSKLKLILVQGQWLS